VIVWLARIAIVLALVLAVAFGVQTWRLHRSEGREVQARAALQGKILVESGWLETLESSHDELAALVPSLRDELAAVKRAHATLLSTSHWTGTGREVPVPCTVVMGPPAGAHEPTSSPPPPAGLPEAPPAVNVVPAVRIDDAVSANDMGGIYVARRVAVRLAVGSSWASEWSEVTPDAGSTTAVDPRLSHAWRAFLEPPPRFAVLPRRVSGWRAGWFAGPALAVGTDGRVSATVAIGWGVQF
jgi:hypothetical protein